MDHYSLHPLANGGNARNSARKETGPVPPTRAGGFRRKTRALDSCTAAAHGGSWGEHSVYGHRREISQEIRRYGVAQQPTNQNHLFHNDVWGCPVRAL